MDEVTVGAVTAVWHSDIDHARRWFDAIGEEYRALLKAGGAADWATYRNRLTGREQHDGLDGGVVDGFASYLERHSRAPMDVVAELADPGIQHELIRMYAEAVQHAHVGQLATDPHPEGDVRQPG